MKKRQEKVESAVKLNVLTYNIRHGRGHDRVVSLERIATIIEQSGADIVGLNEVDKEFSGRSLYVDQTKWLAERLNMHSIFGPSLSIPEKGKRRKREYGNAILSKFPFEQSGTHLFKPSFFRKEGRSILEGQVQIHGVLLDLFVTHISLNPLLRKKQIDYLIEKAVQAKKNGGKVVIMGDFNMRPFSSSWKKVNKVFPDTWSQKYESHSGGWIPFIKRDDISATFPSHKPRMKIDYIFSSTELDVVGTKVLNAIPKASDHLPVFVTFSLNV